MSDVLTTNPRPLFVDWDGAAQLTGVPAKTLRRMAKTGRFLTPTRYGHKTVRFAVAAVERWAAEQAERQTATAAG